uniref:C-X-C motif chemokine n=1 Tax=Sus scrofa TaxID=9823 RepID=A0A8D0K8P7_PIG
MSLRLGAISSCTTSSPFPVLQVLLPLSLLLTTLVPATMGAAKIEGRMAHVELRCLCLNTVSGIHPSNIQSLEVIRAGAHCAKVEVIATLKNDKKICLDPEAPRIKKIVQKIMEDELNSQMLCVFLRESLPQPTVQSVHLILSLVLAQGQQRLGEVD